MCHNRSIHRQINKIHKTAFRIVYVDNNSSFDELLKTSGSVSIHHRNIQQLPIEIYKALNNLTSTLMSELFMIKENKYKLRNEVIRASNLPRSTNYGINSVSHLAPKIWELIPNELRNCIILNLFKEKLRHGYHITAHVMDAESIFTVCSIRLIFIFLQFLYLISVYYMCIICVLYAYYLCIICVLYVYYMRIICVLYVYYMCIICVLYVYYMRIICVLYVYYMCIICVL